MTAYHSIFQKRARPVTCTDFEQAAPLQVKTQFRNDNIHENLRRWNHRIPFLPQDVLRVFESSFGSEARLSVEFDGRHECKQKSDVHFYAMTPSGARFGKLNFFEGVYLSPASEISLKEHYQGQGVGKKWFRFMSELCLAFDHEHLEFSAGLSNGGYTWARAGAHIDLSHAGHTALKRLREKIALRVEAVKPFIPNDVYHSARALGRVVAKDDLTRIADIDFRLSPEACDQMKAWDSPFLNSLSAAFNRHGVDVQTNEQRHAEKCVMGARVQDAPLNIGRYLLVGTTWDAIVDFSDAKQMERIGQYVGGWKTIQPTNRFNQALSLNRSQPSLGNW